MGNKKSTVSDNSGGGEKNNKATASFQDIVPRRRIDISMVQNVLLIWLDNNISEENDDCHNTLTQLRHVVNSIHTFTDGNQCVTFVSEINDNKVCMIISGALGQCIVPIVHKMSQVESIFIFCDNTKRHEQWAKEFPKIKGVFTEIKPICEGLKQAAQECEHNAVAISFMPTSSASNINLNELDVSFMYTQILKEILLSIEFEEQHIKQYVNYCREAFIKNAKELKKVEKFERKYRDETPIWWYTYECFLYPMLNRALRIMDVDIIIKMGFFIRDLHLHIEQLHKEQFGDHYAGQVFTVYRGQRMAKTEFEQLMKTKGGLMSFDNFLSTSKDQTVSLPFARPADNNPDSVGILFVMKIDPSMSSTPFASVNNVSFFQKAEDEILFSMHTVFRIRDIKQMAENNRLWQVDVTLTSDDDQELRALTERMRNETFLNSKGWGRLGQLLLRIGESEKAQQVYEVMKEQSTDDHEKAAIYNQLGWAKYNLGENEKAIAFYENALEIDKKSRPSNHPDLAASYNNIGVAYYSMGDYAKALSSHEKALEIQQKSLPSTHSDLAASYNNIGNVYGEMDDYSKALSSYESALKISRKSLPSTHPDLAASYNNIGGVYDKMGEYSKALSYYEKALEIKQKSLPPKHPNLASSHNNIGLVYYNMGKYSEALSSYTSAVKIGEDSLPSNHPHLDVYRKSLDFVKKKL